MEWLKQLGYTTMEDWYKIVRRIIRSNYGGGLVEQCYNGSITELIKAIYPDYKWLIFNLNLVQMVGGMYMNIKRIYRMVRRELGYTTMEDWYKFQWR